MLKRKLTLLASATLLTPLAVAGAIAPASAATAVTDACADYPNARTGSLAATVPEFYPYNYLTPVEGTYTACLDGPANANFDLELLRWDNTTAGWQVVAASRNADSTERLTWQSSATSTAWRLKIVNNGGSGAYTVGVKFPGDA